jgi:hypothetical protein
VGRSRKALHIFQPPWACQMKELFDAHLSGQMWPGLRRSAARVAGSASARSVSARSAAEMPVLIPCRASTVTVKAVYMASSFSAEETISGSCNRSKALPSMPTQM